VSIVSVSELHSHCGNKTFPGWEQIIPTVGINTPQGCVERSVGFAIRPSSPTLQLEMISKSAKMISKSAKTDAAGHSELCRFMDFD